MRRTVLAVCLILMLCGVAWGAEYSWVCDYEDLAQCLVKHGPYPASQTSNAGGVVNGVRSVEDGIIVNLSVSVPPEYFWLWRYEYDVYLHGGYYPFYRAVTAKSFEDWEWLGNGAFAQYMTIIPIHDGVEWLGNTFDSEGMIATFDVYLSWASCRRM